MCEALRVNRLAVVLGALVLMLAGWPGSAAAHGGATVTIHGDGHGSVWLTARWADGHPVTDPVRASLSATSAAGSAGPVDLEPRGDVFAYAGVLADGPWHVLVTVSAPVMGQCEATVAKQPVEV